MAVAGVRAVLTNPDVRVDPRGLRIRAARFGELPTWPMWTLRTRYT